MALFTINIPKELKLHITIDQSGLNDIRELLININSKIETLMSNTDQALQDIAAIKALLSKIGTETSALLQKIIDLQNNAPADTPQSVLDGLSDVLNQAKTVDDLVPDQA